MLVALDYLDTLRQRRQDARIVKIALNLLQPGLMLARDLMSSSGALLMPRDNLLTVTQVERIRNFARVESIEPIYVCGSNPETGSYGDDVFCARGRRGAVPVPRYPPVSAPIACAFP